MTSKRYSRRQVRQDMNMALDNALSMSDEAALHQHLAKSHKDADLFEGMKTVDRLFSAEPMLQAPPNFAANLMASIAAGKAPQPVAQQPSTNMRALLGFFLATLMLMPVFLLVMSYVHQLLTDPAALSLLLQRMVWLINIVTSTLGSLLQVLAQHINGNLIAFGALLTAGCVMVFWRGFNRVFSRKDLVVYRIPVQVM
jgi:hypothetical protein